MFSVGEHVRVEIDATLSRKGIIACIDEKESLYDIMLQSNSNNDIEELNNIPKSRLRSLEVFEVESIDVTSQTADEIKKNGNTIFHLKDYETAKLFYLNAMKILVYKSISAGLAEYYIY